MKSSICDILLFVYSVILLNVTALRMRDNCWGVTQRNEAMEKAASITKAILQSFIVFILLVIYFPLLIPPTSSLFSMDDIRRIRERQSGGREVLLVSLRFYVIKKIKHFGLTVEVVTLIVIIRQQDVLLCNQEDKALRLDCRSCNAYSHHTSAGCQESTAWHKDHRQKGTAA